MKPGKMNASETVNTVAPARVWAVCGHASDCAAFDHHFALQHAAVRRDNRPTEHMRGRVAAFRDRRRSGGRQRHADGERRHPQANDVHGRNAFGTVTVIVTRFVLSSGPVRRAQSALPHIHVGQPAGRSSCGMSGSSAGVKAAP